MLILRSFHSVNFLRIYINLPGSEIHPYLSSKVTRLFFASFRETREQFPFLSITRDLRRGWFIVPGDGDRETLPYSFILRASRSSRANPLRIRAKKRWTRRTYPYPRAWITRYPPLISTERELSELSGNNECGITGVLPVIISSFVLFLLSCDLVCMPITRVWAFALRLLGLRSGREK